mmetsp:Transcript_60527/g.175279  ORF Transcript_60527/g.175279 Transcript_60527/m.175279 type:complete len:121 (+) Transcript_60527:365-727(+)
MYRGGRSIAAMRPMHTSTDVKCYLHHSPECKLLVYNSSLPAMEDIKKWIAGGRPCAATDPPAVRKAAALEHKAQLVALRDERASRNRAEREAAKAARAKEKAAAKAKAQAKAGPKAAGHP